MIIGLTGRRGVGKDTAAIALLHEGFAKVSFAAPLKELVSNAFGIPLHMLENRSTKDYVFEEPFILNEDDANDIIANFPLPLLGHSQMNAIKDAISGKEINSLRELLQFLGTDVFRNLYDKDVWVNIGINRVNAWLDRGENVVVTDVRMENEAIELKKMGATIIRITRPGVEMDEHETESAYFDVDYTIVNDGPMTDLLEKVEEIWKKSTN